MNHDDMKMLDKPKLQALPLDGANEHQHNDFLNNLFKWAGATTVGLSLAPLALRKIGIGLEQIKLEQGAACCDVIQRHASQNHTLAIEGLLQPINGQALSSKDKKSLGIAGIISGGLSHVPFGDAMFKLEEAILEKMPFSKRKIDGAIDIDPAIHPLARGGVMNMLLGGGLIILGHYGGHALEELDKKHAVKQAQQRGASAAEIAEIEENAGGLWLAAKLATQAAGFIVLMPAILPGIGHSLLSLSTTLGIDKINYAGEATGTGPFSTLAAILGKNPGTCKGDTKLTDSASAVLTSQLCCIAPSVIASIPLLLTHTNTPENKLPAGINPYNKADHELMPNIEKLAQFSDAEIEQRIKDNAFHIADTEAAQQRTSGLRTAIKVGAGVAAAAGTALAANHFLDSRFNAAIAKDAKYGDWHNVDGMTSDIGLPYGSVRFPAEAQLEIDKNIAEKNPFKVLIDALKFQTAKCAIAPEAFPKCAPATSSCCATTFVNAGLAEITKNRALSSGVFATIIGAGAYKLAEHVVDGTDADKKHSLKHEKFVLTAIKQGRAIHEGRVEENSPALLAANFK